MFGKRRTFVISENPQTHQVNKGVYYTAQKMKFTIKGFFSKYDQLISLISFTEEIYDGKLQSLCSVIYADICCICRSPFYEQDTKRDENLFMAKCAKCGEWLHKICLKRIKVSSGNV